MSDAFRTKEGRCVVDGDAIRLEPRDGGPFGTLREALTADDVPGWRRGAIALFGLGLVAGGVAAVLLLPGWLVGVAAGLLATVLVRSWWHDRRRGVTEPETIPVDDVVAVEAHEGVPLLTRSRFVLRYREEGGVKHRYLPCPSRVFGFGAFEAGRALFGEHGLLVDADGSA